MIINMLQQAFVTTWSMMWIKNPIQTHKNEQKRQVLYRDLKERSAIAVELFKPKKPNHIQSLACDMKEWETWRDLRDIVEELNELEAKTNKN